jgi:hypothetical protein
LNSKNYCNLITDLSKFCILPNPYNYSTKKVMNPF